MKTSKGWSCRWHGGALVDDGEVCRLRQKSAARAHVLEVQGGPPVSPMLRVCHTCRADIMVPGKDTYRGTGTDSRPPIEEESVNNNPSGPYMQGTCTDCGQKRSVFRKTSICLPCTMKAYKSGKKSPPVVAPSKAKAPAPAEKGDDQPQVTMFWCARCTLPIEAGKAHECPGDGPGKAYGITASMVQDQPPGKAGRIPTTVDLAAVPGLLPAIEEQAREELRSPEMQALFILREAVKGKAGGK